MNSGRKFCKYVSHLIDLQYSHLSCDDSTLSRNCFNPLPRTDHCDTCHSVMKRPGLDNEGICYWYSIIPSRLKCYGEISWSVPRLSFSLITAWPLPSLYGYLKWENITSMTGYKDTRLWYHDKKIVSQSSNWTGSHNLSARFQKTGEGISNNQPLILFQTQFNSNFSPPTQSVTCR